MTRHPISISWEHSAVKDRKEHIKSLGSSQSTWERGQEEARGHHQTAHKESAGRVQNKWLSTATSNKRSVFHQGCAVSPGWEYLWEEWEVWAPCHWSCSSRDRHQRCYVVQTQAMWLQRLLHPFTKSWLNIYNLQDIMLGWTKQASLWGIGILEGKTVNNLISQRIGDSEKQWERSYFIWE